MRSPQLGQMRVDERHRRGAFTDRAANPRRRGCHGNGGQEVRSICVAPPLRIDEVRDTGLLATTMSLLGVCVAANQILGNTKGGHQLGALVAEYQR